MGRTTRACWALTGVLLVSGCGGGEPPPPATPKPAPAPVKAAPEPVEEPDAGAPEPDAGAPEAGAEGAATEKEPRASSGRPAVQLSGAEEISSTIGTSPATVFELGADKKAVLKVPEGALATGTNVSFKIDKKAKGHGGVLGPVYRVSPKIVSEGPPFEFRFPSHATKVIHVAIGEVTIDEKTGREKVAWSVHPVKDIDDVQNLVHFETTTLPDGYVHLTSKPVTAPKEEKP